MSDAIAVGARVEVTGGPFRGSQGLVEAVRPSDIYPYRVRLTIPIRDNKLTPRDRGFNLGVSRDWLKVLK